MFRYCNQLSGCYLAVCTSSLSVDIDSHLLTLVASSHCWMWLIWVWLDSLLWDKIDNSLWDKEILISERVCSTLTNTLACVVGSDFCRSSDEFLKYVGSPWVKYVLIRLQSELIQVHWFTATTTTTTSGSTTTRSRFAWWASLITNVLPAVQFVVARWMATGAVARAVLHRHSLPD